MLFEELSCVTLAKFEHPAAPAPPAQQWPMPLNVHSATCPSAGFIQGLAQSVIESSAQDADTVPAASTMQFVADEQTRAGDQFPHLASMRIAERALKLWQSARDRVHSKRLLH